MLSMMKIFHWLPIASGIISELVGWQTKGYCITLVDLSFSVSVATLFILCPTILLVHVGNAYLFIKIDVIGSLFFDPLGVIYKFVWTFLEVYPIILSLFICISRWPSLQIPLRWGPCLNHCKSSDQLCAWNKAGCNECLLGECNFRPSAFLEPWTLKLKILKSLVKCKGHQETLEEN